MNQEDNFTGINILASTIGAIVEREGLNLALQRVGLSDEFVLKKWIAPQSSEVATRYAKEIMTENFEGIGDPKSEIYLIKKVFCNPNEYDAMAEAVSDEDTDKFKVLRIIGSNPQLMKYKQKNHGLEAYLLSARTPMEAMRKTSDDKSIMHYASTSFNADDARKLDKLMSKAVYDHTPESLSELFKFMRVYF